MTKTEPRISLVIPAFNEAKTIEACLRAACSQSKPFFEIIVVDNNSTDETVVLASQFPVTVVQESQQGIAYAREAGFKSARGDIFARIDSDTRLPVDWNKILTEHLERNPTHSVVTGPCEFYDFSLKRPARFVHTLIYYRLQRLLTGFWPLWGSNMAISRLVWQKMAENNYPPNLRVHEDIDLTIMLEKAGFTVHFVPKLWATVSLRRGDLSFTNNAHYLLRVPLTYYTRRLYIRSFLILIATLLGIMISLPFWFAYFIFSRFKRRPRE